MYLVGTRGETMDNIKAIERSIITNFRKPFM